VLHFSTTSTVLHFSTASMVTLSQAALKAGRRVDCVVSECRYYDCGTRSEYLQLASELWHQIESRQ
jgi:UTP-glucose-1-phosphate uridylyltransferase